MIKYIDHNNGIIIEESEPLSVNYKAIRLIIGHTVKGPKNIPIIIPWGNHEKFLDVYNN